VAVVATNEAACDRTAAWVRALTQLISALGAIARAAADLFMSFAAGAAATLLPLLHGRTGCSAALTTAVVAASLEAAGPVVASAWQDSSFEAALQEFNNAALQVLKEGNCTSSEVRASAHVFFSDVAWASFDNFAPQLPHVVPPAVIALHMADGSEVHVGSCRRGIRTGAHEEKVAAINALRSYATLGQPFASYLPTTLSSVSALSTHPVADVRIACANALVSIGRCLGSFAENLPEGDDRAAATSMASTVVTALCSLLACGMSEDAAALRCGLQAREDLSDCHGFIALAGENAARLAAAGDGRRSEDVESSNDGKDRGDDEDID